ncbi:MAG: exopolyphosphatase, partial [Bacillota bacterium]|nr:exopolyphosphatase [Bacillota bacterium]
MARKKAYAAIDVGSHEIQMQIAELDKHNPPQIIDTMRRTLPLGTDTYTSGKISQDVLNECITVLQGFVSEMKTYRIAAYRAVATSAFREAANREYVLDQIEKNCGISIQILDNAEERAGHILAASTRMPEFPELIKQGTLLVDVGAGSIQVTVYDKGRFIFSQNMLLGSLRIRELLADLERRTADFAGLM